MRQKLVSVLFRFDFRAQTTFAEWENSLVRFD